MEHLELIVGAFAALNTLAVLVLSFIINSTNGRIKELTASYESLHRDFNNAQIKVAKIEATQQARAEQFDVLSKKLDILSERMEQMKHSYEKATTEFYQKYDLKLKE